MPKFYVAVLIRDKDSQRKIYTGIHKTLFIAKENASIKVPDYRIENIFSITWLQLLLSFQPFHIKINN